jgi:hypothetical protein
MFSFHKKDRKRFTFVDIPDQGLLTIKTHTSCFGAFCCPSSAVQNLSICSSFCFDFICVRKKWNINEIMFCYFQLIDLYFRGLNNMLHHAGCSNTLSQIPSDMSSIFIIGQRFIRLFSLWILTYVTSNSGCYDKAGSKTCCCKFGFEFNWGVKQLFYNHVTTS